MKIKKYISLNLAQFKQWILSILKLRCSKIYDIGIFESKSGYWELIQDLDKDTNDIKNSFRFGHWKTDNKCDNEITITKEELKDLIEFMKQFC